jgi:amino acid adenylation domain-containing protein/non-ribosomal peptide synthase protein (TIGR01720 family)
MIKLASIACKLYNERCLNSDNFNRNVYYLEFIGELDIDKLSSAIKRLVADHGILSSHVEMKEGELCWVKNSEVLGLESQSYVLTNQEMIEQIIKPFDFAKGPLYRFLLQGHENQHRLIIILYPLLVDGLRIDYFCRELINYYTNETYKIGSLTTDLLHEVAELTVKSASSDIGNNFNQIAWEQKLLNTRPLDLNFLRVNYSNDDLTSKKPASLKSHLQQEYGFDEIKFSFDKKVVSLLDKLNRMYNIPGSIFGLCVYATLLHKYSQQEKFSIHYPLSWTRESGFIYNSQNNYTMLPFDFTKVNNFLELIDQLSEFFDALRYNKITISHVSNDSSADLPSKTITNTSYIHSELRQISYESEKLKVDFNYSMEIEYLNDLCITHEGNHEKVNYIVKYKVDKINLVLLNQFIDCFKRFYTEILCDLVHQEHESKLPHLNHYDLFTYQQYKRVIYDWNKTDKIYSDNKSIHELFEEQVEYTPNNIAVVCEGRKLTYRELNIEANKLAYYLTQTYSIQPDTLVILFMDRSEYMLIAILSILKAGGTYVPIDTSYPDERVKYILEDTKSRVVLANDKYVQRIENIIKTDLLEDSKPTKRTSILSIDNAIFHELILTQPFNKLNLKIPSNNLAYVIYTSGTTGNPKGVMIEHNSVVNYIYNIQEYIKLSSKDNVDFSTSIGFDLSVTTTLASLCLGSKVVIFTGQLNDLELYKEHLIQNNINVIKLVPTYFALLVDDLPKTIVNKVILGGEKINPNIITKVSTLYNNQEEDLLRVYDEYGPTETTVGASISKVYPSKSITIGRPYNNYKIYVLDNNLKALPIGMVGDLYIGGDGLARGYLNKSDLTLQRFTKNPFQKEKERKLNKNNRLYKTGDLARWLPDGNLEYIGRNDFQVKIKGYRIELGEIESALQSHIDILQAVVIANQDLLGSTKLVAYVVPGEFTPSVTELREYIAGFLPEYMLPSFYIYLEKLPLTSNGKLDREALPMPEIGSDNYVAPRNELEKVLCHTLSEVLGLQPEKVGINDDFFRLGGDSIISIQLVSKLRQKLGLNVQVKDIFQYKTIEKLFDNVLSKTLHNNIKPNVNTEQGLLKGELLLLPIQEWFFQNDFPVYNHFNQSFLIRVPCLDIDKFKKSVSKLLYHHDSFRLRYKKLKGKYKQFYDGVVQEEVKVLDVSTLEIGKSVQEDQVTLGQILTKWQSNFDIEKGPTYCIAYLYGYSDGSARIFLAFHHLIVDTVSWRILVDDLKELYNQNNLGLKGTSYRQWVDTVKSYAVTYKNEGKYWDKILSDLNSNLLTNFLEVNNDRNYSNINLSTIDTSLLLRDSNIPFNTQINDILLVALGQTLFDITNCKVHHIILEGHGREEIDQSVDINRTMGWFTIFYPVRLEIFEDIDIAIKQVKENLRKIPNKGIGYGSFEGYNIHQLPKIRFNYLGQFDKEQSQASLEVHSASHIEEYCVKQRDFWAITNESCGLTVHESNIDQNIIEINGIIINGKLQFNITSKLKKDISDKFAKIFKEKLEFIIRYTAAKTKNFLTISDIDYIISPYYLDKLQEKREIEQVFLANSLQQGFIYHTINQGQIDDAYIVQMIWKYNSKIDIHKLKEAWTFAQKKFSTLRVRFGWEEQLIQIIDKDGFLDWRYSDLSSERDDLLQASKIKELQEKDRLEYYNLGEGNLFRVYVVKQNEDQFTCLFSSHHSILDGWSISILIQYIHETYIRLLENQVINLKRDHYYEIVQGYLQKHKEDNRLFWNNYISQIEEKDDLSWLLSNNRPIYDHSNGYKHIKNVVEQSFIIENDFLNSIKNLSKKEGITLGAIIQFVWHKTLNIFNNSKQTVIGTTVSGRNLPVSNIEDAVGLLINTLPLIVDHTKLITKTILEAIKSLQENINEISTKTEVDLATLQNNGQRLFDTLFIFENFPNPCTGSYNDRLKIYFQDSIEKLDYPIAAILFESNGLLTFKLKYAGELYSNEVIKHLLLTFQKILQEVVEFPNKKVAALNFVNQEQYQGLIHDWNKTKSLPINNKTIHGLFEEQVQNKPSNIALIYEERQLTYNELNNEANKLAHYLIEKCDIRRDELVVICLDRSDYTLIAILAVLKAGGAYVPTDPSFPDERMRYILEETKNKVVLTNAKYKQKLENLLKPKVFNQERFNNKPCILALDSRELVNELASQSVINHCLEAINSNLAYVIYTSGTTGNPKGVMIEHKAYVAVIECIKDLYLKEQKELKTYSTTNYVFDIFGLEYGLPLLTGGILYLGDNNFNFLDCSRYDFIQMTPSVCNLKLDSLINTDKMLLLIGGENLTYNLLLRILSKSINMVNVYGPTETTIWSVSKSYSSNENKNLLSLSIGKPLYNETVYVLDSNLTPLPVGAIGELYIGGDGLARGYLNNPGLTTEKFIENPFQLEVERKNNINDRLYKTGDLVRWLPDSNLEYIGRNDLQVKIRGFRIELGEIESVLNSYKGVEHCIVLTTSRMVANDEVEDSKYLVAYYLSEDQLDEQKLRDYLQSKLPEYMIPTLLIHIKSLPLTINGKLDKNALPKPEFNRKTMYVAPTDELETQLCKIWAEVIGVSEKEISVNDNFLRIGGNSISAIKIVSRLNKMLRDSVVVSDVFKYNTINSLASYIKQSIKTSESEGTAYVF